MHRWNPRVRVFLLRVFLLLVADDDTRGHWDIDRNKEQIADVLRLLPDTCGKLRRNRDSVRGRVAGGISRTDRLVVTGPDKPKHKQ